MGGRSAGKRIYRSPDVAPLGEEPGRSAVTSPPLEVYEVDGASDKVRPDPPLSTGISAHGSGAWQAGLRKEGKAGFRDAELRLAPWEGGP